MFTQQPNSLLKSAFTNLTFAAATLGAHYADAQNQQEPPAATAPANAEPVLRVENFSEKFRDEIREAIATELDKTIVVVFSVPKLCAPCDLYKPQVEQLAKMLEKEGSTTKIFVVNFNSFEQAEESAVIMQGNTRIRLAPPVPATLVIPKLPNDAIAAIGQQKDAKETQFIPRTPSRSTIRWTGGATPEELREALKRLETFVGEQTTAEGKGPKIPPQLLNANRGWLGFPN
jgi:thiol-disulfide isomerase/thioredoxin